MRDSRDLHQRVLGADVVLPGELVTVAPQVLGAHFEVGAAITTLQQSLSGRQVEPAFRRLLIHDLGPEGIVHVAWTESRH